MSMPSMLNIYIGAITSLIQITRAWSYGLCQNLWLPDYISFSVAWHFDSSVSLFFKQSSSLSGKSKWSAVMRKQTILHIDENKDADPAVQPLIAKLISAFEISAT